MLRRNIAERQSKRFLAMRKLHEWLAIMAFRRPNRRQCRMTIWWIKD